jgi:SAM-dependent methyltransferase
MVVPAHGMSLPDESETDQGRRYRLPAESDARYALTRGRVVAGLFRGLWQEAQLGWWSEDETRAAVDKVERALGLSSPAKILDVPCGDGRISIELATRGHDVTGVDLNEAFLAEAARKAGDRGLSARWEQGDMRELPYESEFEVALNFWGSFGYFDEGGNGTDRGKRVARTDAGRSFPHRPPDGRNRFPRLP